MAKDPDVASYVAAVGGSRPINNGFLMMGLKPRDERKASADEVIRRLRRQIQRRQRRHGVSAGGPGHQHGRPHHPHPVSVHAAGLGPRRAQYLGAETDGGNAEAAGTAGCRLGPADQQPHGVPGDRPGPGRALRHPAGAHRCDAVRCLRPAPGGAVLHPAQRLPRDPGGPPGTAGRSRVARQAVHQVAADRADGAAVDVWRTTTPRTWPRCQSTTRDSFRR